MWNKCDQLPAAGEHQGQQAAAEAEQQPEQQQRQQQQQQQPESAAESSVQDKESAEPRAAAGTGLLPAAVQAMLDGDAAAGGYRPTAVATSVLRRQGLHEVLAAVERKASRYWLNGCVVAQQEERLDLSGCLPEVICTAVPAAEAFLDLQPTLLRAPLLQTMQLEAQLAGRKQQSRRSLKRAAAEREAAAAEEDGRLWAAGRAAGWQG